jgi:outer membrane protein assembly factor BamD
MAGSPIQPEKFSMRKAHAFILFAAGACLLPCHRAAAALDYTPETGWTVEDASGQTAVEKTASAQLEKAEALEKAGDYKHAMVAYLLLTRKFPRSGAAEDAQMKAADMASRAGDYDRAYALYNEYQTKYPKGDDFDQALEGMYNVGQKFLAGAPRRVMGVKTFPSMVRAQNIFESIVKTAPFSKWAPLAQFYAGQAIEKQRHPEDAIAAYEEVISRYPTDPAAADAQYQIGYVYLVQSRTAYDKSAATKAQEAFEDFLARYPNSEKAAQAQDNLKTLQAKENSSAVEIAKYYDKKKDYKAAVIYYNEVIKEQPGTPDAKAAEARINALKAQVGATALEPGPELPENGPRAAEQRRMQAQVETASRSDYLGPPVAEPTPTPAQDDSAPPKPALRTSPEDLGPQPPAVEPPLPAQ